MNQPMASRGGNAPHELTKLLLQVAVVQNMMSGITVLRAVVVLIGRRPILGLDV